MASAQSIGRPVKPNVSSGNAMIVPGSPYRCRFVIELITYETRARSVLVGDTLYFANIPEISFKNRWLISFQATR
jgi:hypothetical protein